MKFYRTIYFVLISFLFLQILAGQTIGSYSESPIYYINETAYSDRITVKFSQNVMKTTRGQRLHDINDILLGYNSLMTHLNSLQIDFGNYQLLKQIPNSTWGDVIRTNIRTGELVTISDNSQLFSLIFTELVPIDSLVDLFTALPFVDYAHGPIQTMDRLIPNDQYYDDQWYLETIKADSAWDITTGDSSVYVAVIEAGGVNFNHPELLNKAVLWDSVIFDYGSHGTSVAGVVAAITNNDSGIASLGWNLSLMGLRYIYDESDPDSVTIPGLIDIAIEAGADIINCSFGTTWDGCPHSYESVEQAIADAISQGVVIVAAGGNRNGGCGGIPFEEYLAWYPGVIGVSATDTSDNFLTSFNYGSGIDVSAPGKTIKTLKVSSSGYSYHSPTGTSVSAPLVSALAGLLISQDSYLTRLEIEKIIEETADKVGQYSYTDGWNQYMGHGRINAHEALKRPNPPTSLTVSGSAGQNPSLRWNTSTSDSTWKYEIYRKIITINNDYTLIASQDHPDTTYTDTGVTIYNRFGSVYVYYKVKAIDNKYRHSDFSNWARTKQREEQSKILSDGLIPLIYGLAQNYPNPFNPTTTLKYDLPENSHVNFIIYDISGRKIKVIVE